MSQQQYSPQEQDSQNFSFADWERRQVKSLVQIRQYIDQLQQVAENFQKRITQMEEQLQRINYDTEFQEERITKLEKDIVGVYSDITEVRSDMNKLQTRHFEATSNLRTQVNELQRQICGPEAEAAALYPLHLQYLQEQLRQQQQIQLGSGGDDPQYVDTTNLSFPPAMAELACRNLPERSYLMSLD